MNCLHNIRAKWFDIGIQLEVDIGKLEEIRSQYQDHQDCLREMLIYRLKRGLSNETLKNALKAPVIDAVGIMLRHKDECKKSVVPSLIMNTLPFSS